LRGSLTDRVTPFGFFHLRSIGGQIAAVVVASIIARHLILTASSRPDRAEPPRFALAHGGELSLHDRKPNGLIVRMQLPMWQPNRLAA
jgi:hypothetical protein